MTKTNMQAAKLRRTFIDYFVHNGHTEVASASLIPAGDPTLLFTNSGMVPFKDVFLGNEKRSYSQAVTAQRCVRAGGKHNDLENVGYTARHHTFFEMLGNFSFGDYFKEQAIAYAWELLTTKIGLPQDSLWVTVHHSDDEARQIWHNKIGVPLERIAGLDEDNFWQMGDTGPCGPCSEVFYDHGPDIVGGPPGSAEQDDGERFIEIWNLVFMQFERSADGKLTPLPKPSVDTGMGLERMAAVLQGVHNNYETDLFDGLIEATKQLCSAQPITSSLHIIADHIRSTAFLIADGVQPGNEGRGYVLRRIMRRALRHGHKLGIRSPFFHQLVAPLIAEMGDAYPIIRNPAVPKIIKEEEQRFAQTLNQGLSLLNKEIERTSGSQLSGKVIFTLYDTYGFPADLTADVAKEKGLDIDWQGFQALMDEQRSRSRAYSMFRKQQHSLPKDVPATEFIGYEQDSADGSLLVLLDDKGKSCRQLEQGQEGIVILDKTPFYAESGGQTGDQGKIINGDGLFEVRDTQKQDGVFLHFGQVTEGQLVAGADGRAELDVHRRKEICRHHSATHLLHSALHHIIGKEAQQRGSRVTYNNLRLDFTYPQAMTEQQLREVEDWVNDHIQAAIPVTISQTSLDEAKKQGALALFGEKYGEQVRVVNMVDASIELCGGTHVSNCADIGSFVLLNEGSISAGVRRVEAATGETARKIHHDRQRTLARLNALLQTHDDQLVDKVAQLRANAEALEKQLAESHKQQQLEKLQTQLQEPRYIDGVQLLALLLEDMTGEALNEFIDRCRQKVQSGIVVLVNTQQDKVSLLIHSSADIAKQYPAKELVGYLTKQFDGSGGGNDERARGGGAKPLNQQELAGVLASVEDWIKSRS